MPGLALLIAAAILGLPTGLLLLALGAASAPAPAMASSATGLLGLVRSVFHLFLVLV
jgi:hypothetical protein